MLALSDSIASPLFLYNLFLKVFAELLNVLAIVNFTAEIFIKVFDLSVFDIAGFCLDQITNFVALADVLTQAIVHRDHTLVVGIEIKCQLTEFMHSVFNELDFLR